MVVVQKNIKIKGVNLHNIFVKNKKPYGDIIKHDSSVIANLFYKYLTTFSDKLLIGRSFLKTFKFQTMHQNSQH